MPRVQRDVACLEYREYREYKEMYKECREMYREYRCCMSRVQRDVVSFGVGWCV